MFPTRKNLSIIGNYRIDLVATDVYTYSIQIYDQSTIMQLPLDPMDHTLAAAIGKDSIEKFGDSAGEILKVLSGVWRQQIGAKEFLAIPANISLPDYTLVENSEFNRCRQVSRKALESTHQIY